jgi:hypothetical protein
MKWIFSTSWHCSSCFMFTCSSTQWFCWTQTSPHCWNWCCLTCQPFHAVEVLGWCLHYSYFSHKLSSYEGANFFWLPHKRFFKLNPTMSLYAFLVVLVGPTIVLTTNTHSPFVSNTVRFLAIVLIIKEWLFLMWLLVVFISLVMLYLMRIFFCLLIFILMLVFASTKNHASPRKYIIFCI